MQIDTKIIIMQLKTQQYTPAYLCVPVHMNDEYTVQEPGARGLPRGQVAFCWSEDHLYYTNKNPECSL